MTAELVEATEHTQVKRKKKKKKENTVAKQQGVSDWLRLLSYDHIDVRQG